jgi:hypothetical protein
MSGSLIPNAKQQFLDANGNPLAGGFVYYYIPSTTTFKNTYQNAALTILNTNPIILDSAGECMAYGAGSYRQIVTDVNGNLIWDQPTLSLSTNDASNVIYTPPFTNAVAETVSTKLSESVSVKDFGAKGDGTTDDTSAIQNAVNSLTNGGTVLIPIGTYKITSTITINNVNLIGQGIFYDSPYTTSAISGTIIKPIGLQNQSAISISSVTTGNGINVGNFGIDMSSMTAGTTNGDFNVATMTKGIYIKDRHNVSLNDIEVYKVPSNSSAFVFYSTSAGGGLYWGNHTKLASRTKLSSGNDTTAKGFVLFGDTEQITAQEFSGCTSYRGWYVKNAVNCQFISCHAENNPKNGVLIDGGQNLTFVGGFYEGQGVEDSSITYYPIQGTNNPLKCTFVGLGVVGNGIFGFLGNNGLVTLNSGVYGQSYDVAVQTVGNMTVDGAGNVNANKNSGALLYASAFNSSVPPSTTQQLFFSSTYGFDQASEWGNSSGNYTFKVPNAALGGGTGVYLVTVNLHLTATASAAIPTTTLAEFQLGGSVNGSAALVGPQKVVAGGTGGTNLYLTGSMMVRLYQGTNQFMTFALYHNNSVNLIVSNASGNISESYVCVAKIN